MLLVAFASLQWYGSATGAMIDTAPVVTSELAIKGYASPAVDVIIVNPTPNLKATRLVNSPLEVQGIGTMQEATPKGRARALLDVSIGAVPSAFDIAQAVLNANAASYNNPNTIGEKINNSDTVGGLTTEQATQILKIYQALMLDPTKPVTNTPNQISFDDVVIDLVGDPEVSVIGTRQ